MIKNVGHLNKIMRINLGLGLLNNLLERYYHETN